LESGRKVEVDREFIGILRFAQDDNKRFQQAFRQEKDE
jgi:hypothetical protein